MKKYTIYEIENLTNGRLTKYKLNQAIKQGKLIAEEVKSEKKGKGIPKYYIYEDKLQEFLNIIEQEKKRTITLPGETNNPELNKEFKQIFEKIIDQKDQIIEAQTSHINSLTERITMLKDENSKLTRISESNPDLDDSDTSSERRNILLELANTNVFSVKKKNKLLQELNRLT
jgi:hypothetical protein